MELFYQVLFDQMHLQLINIKSETFSLAETNIELTKSLLDYEGAAEAYVASPQFFRNGLNGSQISKCTYIGRYLCFSAIYTETKTFR